MIDGKPTNAAMYQWEVGASSEQRLDFFLVHSDLNLVELRLCDAIVCRPQPYIERRQAKDAGKSQTRECPVPSHRAVLPASCLIIIRPDVKSSSIAWA